MAYEKDGIQYPSVTTILGLLGKGDALNYWAAGCACDYIRDNLETIKNPSGPHAVDEVFKTAKSAFKTASKTAIDIGSHVHDAIEQYIKSGKDLSGTLPDEVANSFLAFLEWEKTMNAEWLNSEITLISQKHGYAGTADAVVKLNGRIYLIDFKTSKAIYDEYAIQVAAYAEALEEMYPGKTVDGVGILRIDKITGEPEFRDFSLQRKKRFNAFTKLCEYYYLAANRRLKNNPHVAKAKAAA